MVPKGFIKTCRIRPAKVQPLACPQGTATAKTEGNQAVKEQRGQSEEGLRGRWEPTGYLCLSPSSSPLQIRRQHL